MISANFNPRTPYGMRQFFHSRSLLNINISIHAPLTGCDTGSLLFLLDSSNFNPRTPYGMRQFNLCLMINVFVFQSTHPLRDATMDSTPITRAEHISIHAPLTGCDLQMIDKAYPCEDFNPRTPYGMRPGWRCRAF